MSLHLHEYSAVVKPDAGVLGVDVAGCLGRALDVKAAIGPAKELGFEGPLKGRPADFQFHRRACEACCHQQDHRTGAASCFVHGFMVSLETGSGPALAGHLVQNDRVHRFTGVFTTLNYASAEPDLEHFTIDF